MVCGLWFLGASCWLLVVDSGYDFFVCELEYKVAKIKNCALIYQIVCTIISLHVFIPVPLISKFISVPCRFFALIERRGILGYAEKMIAENDCNKYYTKGYVGSKESLFGESISNQPFQCFATKTGYNDWLIS